MMMKTTKQEKKPTRGQLDGAVLDVRAKTNQIAALETKSVANELSQEDETLSKMVSTMDLLTVAVVGSMAINFWSFVHCILFVYWLQRAELRRVAAYGLQGKDWFGAKTPYIIAFGGQVRTLRSHIIANSEPTCEQPLPLAGHLPDTRHNRQRPSSLQAEGTGQEGLEMRHSLLPGGGPHRCLR